MNHISPPLPWKVIESEYLHNRPWLTVRREKLLMPNGNVVPEYYVLEYPDRVNIIAITKEGQFIQRELLISGQIVQATMAAPLWKYIALHDKQMTP